MLDPVHSCTLSFHLNPHTNLVNVTENKGRLLKDVKAGRYLYMQIFGSCLFLLFLVALPFLIGAYRERSIHREHLEWLTDFYVLHAPDKLLDPNYVERTVVKYKGRMFLLWRGLKRTYNVDWPAPISILETGGDL